MTENKDFKLGHADQIVFFSRLLVDLKLILTGIQPNSLVTIDRLNEGTDLLLQLSQCQGNKESK